MSYDVWIAGESFNYTSNCSALWYDHIPDTGKGGGLHEIAGLTGAKAALVLSESFGRMNKTRHLLWQERVVGEPLMCSKYDAPNGWGSLVGAIIFIGEVLAACLRHPKARVRISA